MTVLPAAVRRGVEESLGGILGRPARVTGARPLPGGCINPSARVDVEDGQAFFLKWNDSAPPEMFEAEAEGLRALRSACEGTRIRVPEVLGSHAGGGPEPSWLLLELVERRSPAPGYAQALGSGLARLHRRGSGEVFGWERDNFIGSLPQANPPMGSWAEFWRDARLAPQLHLARARGHFRGGDGRDLDRLLDRVDAAVEGAGADGPSLLHGDLWGGNVYPGPEGEPVLIDPAVYRGHREVDLAMSELFGGFPSGFLEAYHEAWPLAEGYSNLRRPLYQLYYLLVHVNLFGAGYVAGCVGAAREVLAAL